MNTAFVVIEAIDWAGAPRGLFPPKVAVILNLNAVVRVRPMVVDGSGSYVETSLDRAEGVVLNMADGTRYTVTAAEWRRVLEREGYAGARESVDAV